MSMISYVPLALVAVFFMAFAFLAKDMDKQRRKVWGSFAAGYLVHALLASLVKAIQSGS